VDIVVHQFKGVRVVCGSQRARVRSRCSDEQATRFSHSLATTRNEFFCEVDVEFIQDDFNLVR
jgi:hypothetical protein